MEIVSVEAMVGVSNDKPRNEREVSAEATQTLCRASKRFRHNADIYQVNIYGGGDWTVGIHFEVTLPDSESFPLFADSLEEIADVDTVERL